MLILMLAAQFGIVLPSVRTGSLEPALRAQMNEGGAASAKVRVVVSREGVPTRCDVAFVNGPRSNAEALCKTILKNVRYAPALDDKNMPMPGVVYVWSQWSKGQWLGSAEPQWDPVDLALQVNQMPSGFQDMATFHLRLIVDRAGKVLQCEVQESGLVEHVRLLLCQQAAAEPVEAALDENRAAIASVQPFRLRLTTGAFMDKLMRRIKHR